MAPGYILLYNFLLSLVILIGCSEPDDATIDSKIEELREVYDLPSIATAIIKDDKIIWEGFYGFADEDNKVIPDNETIYGVGSVSKLITVTAVMQQVERGNLDLDVNVNNYLDFTVRNPHYPDDTITTRMLLTHRSSLAWPDGTIVPDFYKTYPGDTAPNLGRWLESFLESGDAWLDERPGKLEQYSNTAISLAGYIVERLSGIDFAQYCRENIFSVLDMTHTDFQHQFLTHGVQAKPYPGTDKYSIAQYPSGGLKTTTSDLSKFIVAYLRGGILEENRILEASSIGKMWTIQNDNSSYGLVWYKTGIGYGHGGAFHGVTAQVEIDKIRKLGFIILINKTRWLISDPDIAYSGGELNKLIASWMNDLIQTASDGS